MLNASIAMCHNVASFTTDVIIKLATLILIVK